MLRGDDYTVILFRRSGGRTHNARLVQCSNREHQGNVGASRFEYALIAPPCPDTPDGSAAFDQAFRPEYAISRRLSDMASLHAR